PLFVNQLVHVILRNALDGCEDPLVLRAAELFFRTQRLMLHENAVLLGDAEVIGGVNPTPVLSLMSMLGATHDVEVEVLDEETNGRVLGLYRLTFADPALMLEEVGREPVYLIMAMSAQKLVRLKPQNLLTGLPIRHLEAVT